jgi:hypothetical protein
MEISGGDRRNVTGNNLLGSVGVVDCAIARLAKIVLTHDPQAAVALKKQAMGVFCGNPGHGLRSAVERLQQRHAQQTNRDQGSIGFHEKFNLVFSPRKVDTIWFSKSSWNNDDELSRNLRANRKS